MKIHAKALGRFLEIFFLLLIPTAIIFFLINHFLPGLLVGEKVVTALEELYGFSLNKLSFPMRVGFFLAGSMSNALIVYALWIGSRIARLYSNGQILTEQSVKLFTVLKTIILYMGLYNSILHAFTIIVLMPKMHYNMIMLSLFCIPIFYALIYIFFAAIAAVVVRGARLQDDQDLTV